MANHVFGDCDFVVDLAVVDLKPPAYEVGENGGRSGVGLDRRRNGPRGHLSQWKAVGEASGEVFRVKGKRKKDI